MSQHLLSARLAVVALFLLSAGVLYAQPATFLDLGTLSDTSAVYTTPDQTNNTQTLASGGIIWYRFTIPVGAINANGTFLDIDSEGSTLSNTDSEIGVYTNTGTLVATDDDDGSGNMSALSFGQTTPTRGPAVAGGVAGNGRDGAMAAGIYWLAYGAFNSVFNATAWNVTTTATATGTAVVNFRHNLVVPGDPEINVQRSAVSIGSGATINIGALAAGSPVTTAWLIQNLGAANTLNITTITANPTGVTNCTTNITTSTAFSVAPAGSSTLNIDVTAGAGAFEFTISIDNDDVTGSEDPYVIVVQGTGLTFVSSLPFLDDFEPATTITNRATQTSGMFPTGTSPITLTNFAIVGQVQAGVSVGTTTPIGTQHAILDFPNGDACSAMDYYFDLSAFNAASDILRLSFAYAENNDESDTQDGVYLSLDGGATWVLNLNVLANAPTQNVYVTRVVDLSAALTAATLNYTNQVVVRFQGQDNVAWAGNDGHFLDNIMLEELQANDVGVLSIDAPVSGGGLTATETVSVTIRNFGTAAQSNFPVSFTVNAGTPVTETFTATIPALSDATFTFAGTADLSTPSTDYTIAATTALTGDANAANDSTSKVVRHLGTVSSFPYLEDFEGATPLADWTITGPAGAWHVTTNHPATGNACLGYCQGETQPSATPDGNYAFGGAANSGFAISPPIAVPATGETAVRMNLFHQGEGAAGFDQVTVGISLSNTTPAFDSTAYGPTGITRAYAPLVFDITAYAGQTVFVIIRFNTVDGIGNANPGPRVDDLEIGEPAEVNVLDGATSVPHRSTVNVGSVPIAGGQDTFSVENQGQFSLTLTGTSPDFVLVTAGTNIATVQVTTQPGTPVAGGTSETFIIDYTFVAGGAFDFAVTIPNDDASPVVYATGTDGVLTLATSNFASATAAFTAADVGAQIVITGSGVGNNGTYVIQSVNSATDVTLTTAPTADEAALAWSHQDSEANYTFTVSGTAVSNAPPAVTVGTGNWVNAGGGLFTLTVNPGDTINDTLNVDDATPDNMTVDVVTAATFTGLTAQPADITTPTAGTINLTWTGTADGSNAPGNYDWTIDIDDGTTTVSITARIIMNNVAPQHTADTGITGDGLAAGTQYVANVAIGAAGAVNIADVTDDNVADNITVSGQTNTASPGGSSVTFTFSTGGSNPDVLAATPSAAPAVADVGNFDYTVNITDGTNTVTVFVRITVSGTAPNISSGAAPANATVGVLYSHQFTATGNPTPTFAVTAGGPLPAWLTLTAGGLLSGTPAIGDVGTVGPFTVTASNGIGTDSEVVTITVSAGVAPTFTNGAVDTTATEGQLYTFTFTATGTPAPTLSASGLPAWLTFTPGTGVLTGTPAAGDVGTAGPITITATNGVNPDATQVFSIVVSAAGGGGGGGGGGGDGGCSTDGSSYGWLALLGLLSTLVFVTRMRGSRE